MPPMTAGTPRSAGDAGPAPSLTRRGLLAAAGAAGAAAAIGPPAAGAAPLAAAAGRPLGRGGSPTSLPALARLARTHGRGEPLAFVDLAAVDRNAQVIQGFARRQGWAVRPALKAFQSPQLCAYILRQLPQPRGLVFHLRQVDEIMSAAPAGTDLLMGYPPTRGELRAYLGSRPPRGQRRHRLTILASSVELLEDLDRLARSTRRPLPLSVALEFDSGLGRGGFHFEREIAAAIKVLRRAKSRLRLRAVLCYDGHATLTGDLAVRQRVAKQAREFYANYLAQLKADGSDLYDARTLIRNGPASANYRNWAGSRECNEISPGSAYMYAGYLKTFDKDGLVRAVTQCAPVLKDTGPYPTELVTQKPLPPITGEAYFLIGSSWPDGDGNQPEFIHPPGVQDNLRGGGRAAVFAPKGSLTTEDYVLLWPHQTGDGIDFFGAVHAVRSGRLLDVWPTFSRWGARP
jgi:D-serine deaminase-like pyridoxal phosphate-dependent protein